MSRPNSNHEWDKYWEENKSPQAAVRIYSIIASFYRNFLIGPRLKNVMKKQVLENSKLLHAGSGAGEVDKFLVDNYRISALDLSAEALMKYSIRFPGSEVVQGNIINLNNLKTKFDGIYNLGVMEHLNSTEIKLALKEFSKLLNTGGKVILFWPPRYGLSVIFLKFIHFVLNTILRKNIFLHPDEPNKVLNKYNFKRYLDGTNLELISFRFSIRDLFTYCVIILQKS